MLELVEAVVVSILELVKLTLIVGMEVVEVSGGNGGEWGGLLDKTSLVIDSDSVFFVFLQEVSIGDSKGGILVF